MSFTVVPGALAILQNGGGGGMRTGALIFQMVAIFAIFYFLFLRPQQKQRKAHEARLLELKKGDKIVTAGGIVGDVVDVKKSMKDGQPVATLEDRLTIRTGETKMIVERGRISRITNDAGTSES